MFNLFKNNKNKFKQLLENNITKIIKLWCLVKWCDYNNYNNYHIKAQRNEWSKELFEIMFEFCKIKVKHKCNVCSTHVVHKCNVCSTHVVHKCNVCSTHVVHKCNVCSTHVVHKSDIIYDVFIKKNNLNNQDNIKIIIADTFKKYNIDENYINLISISCAHNIEGICKALDFEFDNQLYNYINDALG